MPFLPSSFTTTTTSSNELFTVSFPSQHSIHVPSSLVAGTVHVETAACRRDGVVAVEAHLVCRQRSIYYKYYGGDVHDYRTQDCVLYEDKVGIWSTNEDDDDAALAGKMDDTSLSVDQEASSQDADDGGSGLLTKVLSRVASKGKGRAPSDRPSNDSAAAADALSIPFSFALPAPPNELPPTFEGGTRTKAWYLEGTTGTKGRTTGRGMGFTRWFVKIVGRRPGRFKADRKQIHLFVYSPSATTPPTAVPPPLLPRADGAAPDRPSREAGWTTVGVVKAHREGIFKKKGLIVAQLALPNLPSYPSPLEIPFHLTILRLSPPLSTGSSSSKAASSTTFKADDVKVQLVRNVWTKARGADQDFDQSAVDECVVPLSRQSFVDEGRVFEESAWTGLEDERQVRAKAGEKEKEDDEDESEDEPSSQGIRRAGFEVVITGSLRFPVGPSFDRGISPKGHLACSYNLALALPLSSRFSSSTTLTLLTRLPISTCLPEGQGVAPSEAIELDPDAAVGGLGLPGYFEVVGGEGDGWDDDEKK